MAEQLKSKEGLHKKSSAIDFVMILIVLLVSFVVYFNALFGNFVYDDTPQIVDNPWIRDFRYIPTIFSKGVWSFEQYISTSNYYRPLMHIVYMLNYYLFGLNALGFHLVNILFHAANSLLVFLLIERLSGGTRVSDQHGSRFTVHDSRTPAFIAALLFAVHPIHTEAVTWIAGLPDVAFTLFYLLSFYLYIRSRVLLSGSYVSSVICFAVAAFFKEPALTLPILLLAYDYAFRKERTHFRGCLKNYFPYLVIGLVYLLLRIHALGEFAPLKSNANPLNAYQYALNDVVLFVQYLIKLVVPLGLNAFYSFHPMDSLFELKTALCATVTAVFAVVLFVTLRKNKLAFISLVLLSVPLLPVLYIPALGGSPPFAERYLYLPSVGYILLIAVVLSWCEEKLPHAVKGVTIVFSVIGVLYAAGTVTRNDVWQNNFTLWSDTVEKSPDNAIAHFSLGNAAAAQGLLDKAIAELRTALRLKPDFIEAYDSLAAAYASQGRFDEAITECQMALALKPDNIKAHYNLGNAYAAQGRFDEAITEFQIALALNPSYVKAHYSLGNVYTLQGLYDKAIAEFQMALALRPDFYEARRRLDDIALGRPHGP